MAEENRVCPNCGTPLAVNNGRYFCPTCGTEFAIDFGKEDVALAEGATAEERARANMERQQAINATKAQIAERERTNQKHREWNKLFRYGKNTVIFYAVALVAFILTGMLISYGIKSFAKSEAGKKLSDSGKIESTTAVPTETASPKTISKDPEFLKNVVDSGLYYVKYEIPDEVTFEDGKTGKKTGDTGIDSFYYLDFGNTSGLCIVYSLEYQIEETKENVTAFVPVLFSNLTVLDKDEVLSSYSPGGLRGEEKKEYGYLDKEKLLQDVFEKRDDLKAEEMEVPDSVRSYMKKA